MRRKEDVLKYLADIRSFYLPYHNQKEMMMWVSVGASLTFPAISFLAFKNIDPKIDTRHLIATIIDMATYIFIAYFFYQQNSMRVFAADANAASFLLSSEILKDEKLVSSMNFEINQKERRIDGSIFLPECIFEAIRRIRDTRRRIAGRPSPLGPVD